MGPANVDQVAVFLYCTPHSHPRHHHHTLPSINDIVKGRGRLRFACLTDNLFGTRSPCPIAMVSFVRPGKGNKSSDKGDVEKDATATTARHAGRGSVSQATPPRYPSRPFYRKVPFLSTAPRPYISNFDDPKVLPENGASWWSLLWFSWCNETLTAG